MLFPEPVPPPQLSAYAAERYAQLSAVAELRTERKHERRQQRQRQAGSQPVSAAT